MHCCIYTVSSWIRFQRVYIVDPYCTMDIASDDLDNASNRIDNVKYLSDSAREGLALITRKDGCANMMTCLMRAPENQYSSSIYGFADVVGQYYLPHNVIRMDGQLSLQLWNVGIADNH
jgi:hypothetical protein